MSPKTMGAWTIGSWVDASTGCMVNIRETLSPRCLWSRSLAAHALVLFVILMFGLLFTRPHVAYSSDEGSVVLQARLLEQGRGWLYGSPISDIDPDGAARPFVRGDVGSKGVAPYAKHPLYPLVISGVDRLGGDLAIGVFGAVSTVAVALLSALLARHLDPGLDRTVFWLVGLGSPLFFDSYLVLAHTLAAAAMTVAFMMALRLSRDGVGRAGAIVSASGVVAATALGGMFRTEMLLVGPAACVVLVSVIAVRSLSGRRPVVRLGEVTVCASLLMGTVIAYSVDRLWARAIVGSPYPGVPNAQPSSWVAGRIQATQITWFSPSRHLDPVVDVALLAALVLLGSAGLLAHKGERRGRLVTASVLIATACYLLRLSPAGSDLIPGLMVAFPAGWFLMWAYSPRSTLSRGTRLLVGILVTSALAVLTTQYPIGGGVEWGGRYFAFLIPVFAAVAVTGAAPTLRKFDRETIRLIVACLVVMSLAVSITALRTIRDTHVATARLLDGVALAAAEAGPSGPYDRPVVISPNRLIPQIAYRDFDEYTWVVPDHAELPAMVDRLSAKGVDRAVLAADDVDSVLDELEGWSIERRIEGLPWGVSVIERR